MKLLTKSQSFDNIIRDTEEQIEKAITDYLNDMTVDDLDKVVKNSEVIEIRNSRGDLLQLNGISKTIDTFWLSFTELTFGFNDCNYTIDALSLQEKRQLLKLIEETI